MPILLKMLVRWFATAFSLRESAERGWPQGAQLPNCLLQFAPIEGEDALALCRGCGNFDVVEARDNLQAVI
jgi:hypothetical protein